jgi:hypothetical protein
MTDITIPPAALEAGITAFADAEINDYTSQAEDLAVAFLAMLRAWEGMQHDNYVIVLPLPQEASDD